VRRTWGAVLVVTVAMGGGCSSSSSVNASKCGRTLDTYHAALVASDDGTGPNLSDAQQAVNQDAVVRDCDEATFQALLKGDGYDYTQGPDAIALADPHDVFAAFCGDAPKPNHC